MPNALVTGASQGFGLALTTALTAEGWTVVADARDERRLRAALAASDQVVALAGDVTDPGHRDALVAAARELGGLDLLVHNASELGPSPLPALVHLDVDSYRRLLDVNVVAPLALTQLLVPLLRHSPTPAIVMLSSDAAVEAYPGWGGYGSSKAAVDHLATVLGAEHPELAVYAFDPGDMRTDMHRRAFPGEDISDRAEPAEVVPRLLHLLATRPSSGRYRATDLAAQEAA